MRHAFLHIISLAFFLLIFYIIYIKFLFHRIKAKDPFLILIGLVGIISGLSSLPYVFYASENILNLLNLFGIYTIIIGYGLLQLKKWAWWIWFISICIFIGGILILEALSDGPSFFPLIILPLGIGIVVYCKRGWFNIENIKISDIEKAVENCSNSNDAAALLKISERNFERICYTLGYLLPWEEEIIIKAIKSSDNSIDAAKKLKMPKYFFEGICKEFGIELPWKQEK